MGHLDIREPQLTVTRSKMMKARIMFCSSVIIMSSNVTLTRFKVDELQLKPVRHRIITLLIIKITVSSIAIG